MTNKAVNVLAVMRGGARVYLISVVDPAVKRWPGPRALATAGVGIDIARRYGQVRREFTAGLRRGLKERQS